MPTILSFLLRSVLLVAGLVFAASVAVAFAIMLAVWFVRAGWARLTGRPVTPFVTRMRPRGGFNQVYRHSAPASRTPRADAAPLGRVGDVTDVEPKQR